MSAQFPQLVNRKQAEDPAEPWLTSYADLMSMLLAVFVVFFSMSSINEKKAEGVSQAISAYLTKKTNVEVAVDRYEGSSARKFLLEDLATILNLTNTKDLAERIQALKEDSSEVRELQKTIKELGVVGSAKLTTHRPSFDIEIPARMLFESGTHQLNREAKRTIQTFLPALRKMVKQEGKVLEIVGHSDSDPVQAKSGTRSLYGLSALRAESVLLALSEMGIPLSSMTIVAAGSNFPLYPERLPGGVVDRSAKEKNRRVTIRVMKP